ncbi:MAG: hypothetical protein KDK66_01910, partial [Deltaproteobacteria bacterium]|nr:hypothetical protein [Deltaproteobacteria bacterium]
SVGPKQDSPSTGWETDPTSLIGRIDFYSQNQKDLENLSVLIENQAQAQWDSGPFTPPLFLARSYQESLLRHPGWQVRVEQFEEKLGDQIALAQYPETALPDEDAPTGEVEVLPPSEEDCQVAYWKEGKTPDQIQAIQTQLEERTALQDLVLELESMPLENSEDLARFREILQVLQNKEAQVLLAEVNKIAQETRELDPNHPRWDYLETLLARLNTQEDPQLDQALWNLRLQQVLIVGEVLLADYPRFQDFQARVYQWDENRPLSAQAFQELNQEADWISKMALIEGTLPHLEQRIQDLDARRAPTRGGGVINELIEDEKVLLEAREKLLASRHALEEGEIAHATETLIGLYDNPKLRRVLKDATIQGLNTFALKVAVGVFAEIALGLALSLSASYLAEGAGVFLYFRRSGQALSWGRAFSMPLREVPSLGARVLIRSGGNMAGGLTFGTYNYIKSRLHTGQDFWPQTGQRKEAFFDWLGHVAYAVGCFFVGNALMRGFELGLERVALARARFQLGLETQASQVQNLGAEIFESWTLSLGEEGFGLTNVLIYGARLTLVSAGLTPTTAVLSETKASIQGLGRGESWQMDGARALEAAQGSLHWEYFGTTGLLVGIFDLTHLTLRGLVQAGAWSLARGRDYFKANPPNGEALSMPMMAGWWFMGRWIPKTKPESHETESEPISRPIEERISPEVKQRDARRDPTRPQPAAETTDIPPSPPHPVLEGLTPPEASSPRSPHPNEITDGNLQAFHRSLSTSEDLPAVGNRRDGSTERERPAAERSPASPTREGTTQEDLVPPRGGPQDPAREMYQASRDLEAEAEVLARAQNPRNIPFREIPREILRQALASVRLLRGIHLTRLRARQTRTEALRDRLEFLNDFLPRLQSYHKARSQGKLSPKETIKPKEWEQLGEICKQLGISEQTLRANLAKGQEAGLESLVESLQGTLRTRLRVEVAPSRAILSLLGRLDKAESDLSKEEISYQEAERLLGELDFLYRQTPQKIPDKSDALVHLQQAQRLLARW